MTVGRICGAHRAPLQKNSFDKDSSGPAANMSILRKINFGDWRVVIEQRADPFHDIEADISDFSLAQPFQNFAALKGNRQLAQLRDRKSRLCRRGSGGQVDIGGTWELVFDPVFFFAANRCRAPDALANISPEVLLQIRNDSPTNPLVPS